jgi:predicted kinase
MLIAMCGLPGAGKSTVALAVGRALGAPVMSVDPVEAAMLRSGVDPGQPTGLAAYVVVEAVAEGNLGMGRPVIVDAVNDAPQARAQWVGLAGRAGVPVRFVEVVCSDVGLHRARLAGRGRRFEALAEPSWESVQRRQAAFEAWREPRLVVDSVFPVAQVVAAVMRYVEGVG